MRLALPLAQRLAKLDWQGIERALDERGYATTPPLLGARECAALIALYDEEPRFRKRVIMERLGFGLGEYKYFAAPLPPLVEELRVALYAALVPVANRWRAALAPHSRAFAPTLEAFIRQCRVRGQERPTPLMLRYEAGGFNCLHQDLYGEMVFPLQVTLMLSRPEQDYRGGEFMLVEDRPRAQARGMATALARGTAIIFASSFRPIQGRRGYYRVRMRHGVSPLQAGLRYTLGIIFHNAR